MTFLTRDISNNNNCIYLSMTDKEVGPRKLIVIIRRKFKSLYLNLMYMRSYRFPS